jgi:hypothetical protein
VLILCEENLSCLECFHPSNEQEKYVCTHLTVTISYSFLLIYGFRRKAPFIETNDFSEINDGHDDEDPEQLPQNLMSSLTLQVIRHCQDISSRRTKTNSTDLCYNPINLCRKHRPECSHLVIGLARTVWAPVRISQHVAHQV